MSQAGSVSQVYVFTRPLAYYGATLTLCLVLFVGGLCLLAGLVPIGDLSLAGFGLVAAAVLLGLSVAWRRSAFQLVVAAERIDFRQGVFSREEHVLMTDMVVGVDLLQTLGDRALGIGTIVIGTTGMDSVRCAGISRPRQARDLIRTMHSQRMAGRPGR